MNEQQCLDRMVAPGTPRPGKWRRGVIQVWVTRSCNMACFSCTQLSQLRGAKPRGMTVDQYAQALESLRGYFGVVGLFGGNPAMHPDFLELCRVLRESWVPKEQRGIWCNDPITVDNATAMRETFDPAVSNLNVHLDREAFHRFRAGWPESRPVGLDADSRHSPTMVAMRDVVADESRRWDLIANCDINQHWSAMIGVFRGELRAWFCEVAGAQAMIHQDDLQYPDTGLPAEPGWWQLGMDAFAAQVRQHCHACSVPLRGRGQLAQGPESQAEQVSEMHAAVFQPKRTGRPVERVSQLVQLGQPLGLITDYIGNGKR